MLKGKLHCSDEKASDWELDVLLERTLEAMKVTEVDVAEQME